MSADTITLAQYWDRCRYADWFYGYSDDPAMYRKGKDQIEALERDAKLSREHAEIFVAWQAYHNDYENKARELPPKPVEVEA